MRIGPQGVFPEIASGLKWDKDSKLVGPSPEFCRTVVKNNQPDSAPHSPIQISPDHD